MGATLSVLASVAVLRSTVKEFIPPEIRTYLIDLGRRFSSELVFVIQESHEGSTNHLFKAVATYLGSAAVTTSAPPRRLTVGKNESMKVLTFGLDRNSEIVDHFNGIPMRWAYQSETNSAIHFELKWYELRINRRHGQLAKSNYIPHILESAKRIRDLSRVVKFYTTRSGRDGWSSKGTNLDHPMNFDTLAMDGDLKQKVIEDLDSFIGGRDYYRKIGKVWKRGYLLYGPPGTGKSSLIASMANYLNFDIYNLNLSVVNSDSSLEHLLLHMSNRSMLVVEDIDCSVMLQNREAMDRPLQENHNHGTGGPIQIPPPRPNQAKNDPAFVMFEYFLLHMSNRSMLGVEDIDFSVMLQNREAMDMPLQLNQNHDTGGSIQIPPRPNQVTLSGLLNAIDGLLSCCGDERIVIFTTNYKDRIDPALLRAGRMDMHIHLTYCTFSTFKQLAVNYLDIQDHKLFGQVEKLISQVEVSPAEVAGELMKDRDPHSCLNGLITYLQTKKAEVKVKSCSPPEQTGCNEIDGRVCNPILEVGGYRIKEHLASTLRTIITEHGDIAANCTLKSGDCRSALLELVCEMVKKLEGSNEKKLTKAEIKSMAYSVGDLESMKLEVGWLIGRLDETVPVCNGAEAIA